MSGSTVPLRRTRLRLAAVVAAVAALLLAVGSGSAEPAYAAARVSVSSSLGGATADAEYATTLNVSGAGFQSIQGGFGGVYVLFGWAGDGWRPSQGGAVGADYRYVPDSESKDNQGFQRFVAFPGSETESAANAVMGSNGSWSVSIVVPGALFNTVDRDGNAVQVDCRRMQCGVITIGAHGVKNANNETFTPVSFVAGGGAGGTPSGSGSDASTGAAAGAAGGVAAAPVGELRIGFDPAGAIAGNAFAFTARGFIPAEQVVAVLDRGAVALGPLTAGSGGEVAGVLALPADLAPGTHLLTVTGAASGGVAESEVLVAAGPSLVIAPSAEPEVPAWLYAVMFLAIVLALALLVVNITARVVRGFLRRRARRREAMDAADAASGTAAPTVDGAESSGPHSHPLDAPLLPPDGAVQDDQSTAPLEPARDEVAQDDQPTTPLEVRA